MTFSLVTSPLLFQAACHLPIFQIGKILNNFWYMEFAEGGRYRQQAGMCRPI
jgi:hypothetical protein